MKQTVKEMESIIALEEKRIMQAIFDKTDGNNGNKQLKALKYFKQLLNSVADDTVFDNEGVKNNALRGFDMFNLGTATEQIIKYIKNPHKYLKKSVAKTFDTVLSGIGRIEIKASLGHCSKSSPYNGEKRVLLINQKGVMLITENIASYVDKYGRFSPVLDGCGEHLTELEKLLGY